MKILKSRLLETSNDDGGAGGGGEARPDPAAVNQRVNNDRLSRMEAISRTADSRRAHQLQDVDGDSVTGDFAGGEFADDAAERRQLEADELERQEREEAEEQARARALQGEGADDEERETDSHSRRSGRTAADEAGGRGARDDDESDEKVVDGVTYYRTIVAGEEKWLTLKQLREGVSNGLTTEETLRRAQEALASASRTEPTPKAAPVEVSDADLENIFLSAATGDEEAVKQLVTVIKARPKGVDPADIDALVAQRIATQREVDLAEKAVEDLLGNKTLAPEFKRRLTAFAERSPKTKIREAYDKVAQEMRKDFAPMLGNPRREQESRDPPHIQDKATRKRSMTPPVRGAGRLPRTDGNEREPTVADEIDAIAKSRGQMRAHRIRRS